MWRNSRWGGLLPHSRKREAGEKERAPEYRFYRFGRRQFLVYGLEGLLLIGLLAWFFYRSLWAMLPLSFLLPFFLSEVQRGLAKQRRQELSIQFRDMILSVAAGLQAGYSVENAFLCLLYTSYECHIGSWMKHPDGTEDGFYTYREFADRLVAYLKEVKFTHCLLYTSMLRSRKETNVHCVSELG